jgi:hypothetical protein
MHELSLNTNGILGRKRAFAFPVSALNVLRNYTHEKQIQKPQ